MFRALILAVISLAFGAVVAPAQGITDQDLYTEIVHLQGIEQGAGGRALALGGAYRALSDDLSGLYWNPAGLASVRRIEIVFGMSQAIARDRVKGTPSSTDDLSKTRLNEVGLVFPFPTYRGSLVLALGYHQVHNYDNMGTFREESSLAWQFAGNEIMTGRLGLWSLGSAMDISQYLSMGLALRVWTGFRDLAWDAYIYENALNDSSHKYTSDLELTGFNLLGGIIWTPIPILRVGATLETPLKLSVDENFNESFVWRDNAVYTDSSFSEGYAYHVSRPFRFGLGAAIQLGRFGISSDLVFNDWSQIGFADEPPSLYKDEANREIVRRLAPKADYHVGLEYWLPFLEARVQAGYAYLSTPFDDTATLGNKQVFSGGFGILLDPSLHLQTSASLSQWDRSIGGWDEDLKLTHLLVTLSYRF